MFFEGCLATYTGQWKVIAALRTDDEEVDGMTVDK